METIKLSRYQDEVVTEFDFNIDPIPAEIGDALVYDCILGNSVQITTYDLQAYKNYDKLEVQAVSVDLAEERERFNLKEFLIKFTNRKDNVIKNNY